MKLLIISAILNSAYSQWLHTCSHTLPSLASRSAQYLHLSVASYLSFCTSVYANERVVFFVCVSSLHRLLFAVLPPPMGLVAVFFSVAFAQLSFSFSLIFVFHFQFVEHRIHWDFPLYLFFRFIYTHHQINNFILNSTECGSIHIRIYYLDIFKFIHSYLTRLGVILYIYKKNSVCFFSLSRSHTHTLASGWIAFGSRLSLFTVVRVIIQAMASSSCNHRFQWCYEFILL